MACQITLRASCGHLLGGAERYDTLLDVEANRSSDLLALVSLLPLIQGSFKGDVNTGPYKRYM